MIMKWSVHNNNYLVLLQQKYELIKNIKISPLYGTCFHSMICLTISIDTFCNICVLGCKKKKEKKIETKYLERISWVTSTRYLLSYLIHIELRIARAMTRIISNPFVWGLAQKRQPMSELIRSQSPGVWLAVYPRHVFRFFLHRLIVITNVYHIYLFTDHGRWDLRVCLYVYTIMWLVHIRYQKNNVMWKK